MIWWMIGLGIFCFTGGFMLNAVLTAASNADDVLLGDDQYNE